MTIYTKKPVCGYQPTYGSSKPPPPPTSGSNAVKPQEAVILTRRCLKPLERNELEKAMLGRGVDYETVQLILRDFDSRVEHLYSVIYPKDNK